MSFKLMELPKLIQFTQELKEEDFAHNIDRLASVKLFKKISGTKDPHADKLITGLGIFMMEEIGDQYRTDPHPYELFGYKIKGSKLYDRLEKGLGISNNNHLTDSNKLSYLIYLYKYIKDSNEIIFSPEEKNKISTLLLAQIKKTYTRPVIQDQINKILTQPFTPNALAKRFTQIPEKYKAHVEDYSKSKWAYIASTSKEHLDHVKLIELFTSNEFSNLVIASATSKDKRMWIRNDNIHMALPLYIMSEIEAEYSRSPENSKLYTLCQESINIKHTSHLPSFLKNHYYSELNAVITALLLDQKFTASWNKEFKNPKYLLEFKKKVVTKINQLTHPEDKSYLSYLTAGLTGIALYSAQSEIDLSIKKVTNNIYYNLGPGKLVMDHGIELIGYICLGPKGAIIAGYLAPMIEKQLISFTLASVFYRLIVQVGNICEKTLGTACSITFAMTAEGAKALAGLCRRLYTIAEKKGEKLDLDLEFIDALLLTPDEVFSADKKDILKDIVEPDDAPKAVSKEEAFAKADKASINNEIVFSYFK